MLVLFQYGMQTKLIDRPWIQHQKVFESLLWDPDLQGVRDNEYRQFQIYFAISITNFIFCEKLHKELFWSIPVLFAWSARDYN